MLLRKNNVFALGTALVLGTVWSGCEATKQTEYVAGVSTQVQVPRDLKTIRLDVSVGGVPKFCRAYRVYDGRVQLPRSLGSFPTTDNNLGEPITVTVVGFTDDVSDPARSNEYDCLKTIVAGDNARILRRSRQPYVKDEVLFLPMALKYSCFDKDCETSGQDRTCKAGRCVDAATDQTKLPKFSEDLVDGTGGACFHASECFASAVPAVVVDTNDCTYALPNTASAPPQVEGAPPNPITTVGEGVNVEITYDGGYTREILDKDEAEGFTIPDATKPQRFRLAAGLCDMVKGVDPDGNPTKHRITAVRATGLCQAKSPFQPLCAADQLAGMGADANGVSPNSDAPDACNPIELKPPKAVLMVLADDTHNSDLFYTQAGQATVGLSLSDPAFSKTEIGLELFPGNGLSGGTCGPAGSFTPAVTPRIASQAKTDVLAAFVQRDPTTAGNEGALKPIDTPVLLDGALGDAYTLLGGAQYADYFRRAVLVLGNRGFDSNTCAGNQTPADRAAAAHTASKIDTYVLMLARDNQLPADTVLPGANELAIGGGTDFAYDARANKSNAQDAFQRIVNDLATCVYDVPTAAERPAAGQSLSYSDPVAGSTVVLPFNASCNSQTANASGWGVDPTNDKRVYLCGDSCTGYRSVVRTAALYAAQNLQPALAVPVFAHKEGCAPTASGPQPSGGGNSGGADAGTGTDASTSTDSGADAGDGG